MTSDVPTSQSSSGEIAVLRDLRSRLDEKAAILYRMPLDSAAARSDAVRLRGKAEGVRLAISLIDEYLRDAETGGSEVQS